SPLFFQCYRYHPDLHSFPTRRSSDLYSPLKTGAGFLPMSVMIVLTATTVQTRVLPRTGAKPLVVSGMGLGVTAMVLLSHVTSHGAYVSHVLPGLLLSGTAMGLIFAPAFSTATLGVRSSDA